MKRASLSATGWKRLLTLLVACALALLGSELLNAIAPLGEGHQGKLGLVLDDGNGRGPSGTDSQRLRVLAIDPDSSAFAAGVRVGSLLSFQRPLDRWRRFGDDERVPLLVYEAGGARAITVAAERSDVTFADDFDYLGRCALSLPALGFCLLIGRARPAERSYRELALCFLSLSLTVYYTFNFSPPGMALAVGKLANLATYGLTWYFAASFALAYQPYDATPPRRLLRSVLPWYRMLSFATVPYALWFGLGHDAPGLSVLILACALGGLLLTTASLVDGLHQTRGNLRMRHQWLLLAFACGALPSALTLVPAFDEAYRGVRYTVMASFAGQLLMYAGLVYAVLRHRVFEFDVRACFSQLTVLGAASLLLLFVFGLVSHMVNLLFERRIEHTMLEAIVVLPVLYLLDCVHDGVERSVERFLFRSAHQREHALREFVRRAAHFSSAEALMGALVAALGRFSQEAGIAVYLARDGDLVRVASSLAQAAPVLVLDPDQRAALGRDGADQGQASETPPGALALPMYHRGAMHGVVLVGRKPNGKAYRPDECAALANAVHQVGLDLDTLHVDALEARIDALQRDAQVRELELRLVAGRRHAPRPGSAPAADEAGKQARTPGYIASGQR